MMRRIAIAIICLVNNLVVAEDLTKHPNWYLIDHEQCGESMADRIIGGREANLGQYAWLARLGYIKPTKGIFEVKPRGFKCGGSLINNMYVLTAAHCVTDLGRDVLALIRLGEHDTRTTVDCQGDICAPPVQDFSPAKVVMHENYQNPAMRNDMALIRLDRPAEINSFVYPICLPYGPLLTMNFLGKKMEVAGWGVDDVKLRSTSTVPMVVHVPVVKLERCVETLRLHYATLGEGQICAGGNVGYDSCGGDSGGPLMAPQAIDGPPRYFLLGVVSFGSITCGGIAPAVYSDVAYFMRWILDNIEP